LWAGGEVPSCLIDSFLLSGGVGGVEALERARAVVRLRRGAEVADAELLHEFLDEPGTLVAHELLPASELGVAGAPVEAPVAESVDDRESPDAGFSEAEARALPAGGGSAGVRIPASTFLR
jgi:hypothetical protein